MIESSSSHNQPEFTVTEVSQALKRTVEDAFGHVRIRGEISGYKRAPSGHVYFSLKDERSVIASVCWKGTALRLPFTPEDGVEVICTGRITTYGGRSQYQLVVESMEHAGVGALMALLEKRKQQLAKEGLFATERKKDIPFFPKVIGVVTSPTGAVIRDILHRLEERLPCHVLLWPVLVQGDEAAKQITSAIQGFNALDEEGDIPRPDVLIVARGGGSIEDLWPFNEEIVVRAAAASDIPLISAVGHETDTTLIDYASDLRAPTPTAAAEMAVPVREELLADLAENERRLKQTVLRFVKEQESYINALARGLPNPGQLTEYAAQRFDAVAERFAGAALRALEYKQRSLAECALRLKPQQMLWHITRWDDQLRNTVDRMRRMTQHSFQMLGKQLMLQERLLESADYKNILKRGFALVRDKNKTLVTSAQAMQTGQAYSAEFSDGNVKIAMEGKPPTRKKKKPPGDTQSSLF